MLVPTHHVVDALLSCSNSILGSEEKTRFLSPVISSFEEKPLLAGASAQWERIYIIGFLGFLLLNGGFFMQLPTEGKTQVVTISRPTSGREELDIQPADFFIEEGDVRRLILKVDGREFSLRISNDIIISPDDVLVQIFEAVDVSTIRTSDNIRREYKTSSVSDKTQQCLFQFPRGLKGGPSAIDFTLCIMPPESTGERRFSQQLKIEEGQVILSAVGNKNPGPLYN